MINSNIFFLKDKIVNLCFSIYFFLWGLDIYGFDIRYIILIPLIFKIHKINKIKKYFFEITIFSIIYFFPYALFKIDNSIYDIFFNYFIILIIFFIGILYYDEISARLREIIFYFLIIFCIYNILFLLHFDFSCLIGCFSIFKKLFNENSHLALTAIPIIFYLNLDILKKNFFLLNVLFLFFLLVVFLNSSVTLILGISLIIFVILFLKFLLKIRMDYKYLKKKVFYPTIILILFLLFNPNLRSLIDQKFYSQVLNIKKNIEFENLNSEKKLLPNQSKKTMPLFINNENSDTRKNISYEVYELSIKIALRSLKDNLFGVGMNNYNYSYYKYSNNFIVQNKITGILNHYDGSNNLSKLITELGIFFLIIIYLVYKFIVNQNIDLNLKIFLLSIIFPQLLIRGVGLYNSGFLLSLVFVYLLNKNTDNVLH